MIKKTPSRNKAFPSEMIRHWEKSDGINFAIALHRITGWLLSIDFLTPHNHANLNEMLPVRAYVETNEDIVFDFTGKRSIMAFNKYIVMPIAISRARNHSEHIATRSFEEKGLAEVKLREKPNETEIARASKLILANKSFLEMIPRREITSISSYHAAQFSQGNCIPFADALSSLNGLPIYGINSIKHSAECNNIPGFCHVVVMHPDGSVEDSWGRQHLEAVLKRFYILEYTIDQETYFEHRTRQINEHPDRFQKAYELAIKLLGDRANAGK